jgi:transcriptional regulator NrdR family protein
MVCIYCGGKTHVTNSRSSAKDSLTWRRRECLACKSVLTSIEKYPVEESLMVEKRDLSVQPFFRDKLFLSIFKSIDHLKNAPANAGYLTETAIRLLLKPKPVNPLIKSTDIAHAAKKVLKNYNAASVIKYEAFQSNLQLPRDIKRTLKF